jgi:hypothetical protein
MFNKFVRLGTKHLYKLELHFKSKDMMEYQEGFHTYYVYILNKAFCTWVTNDLKFDCSIRQNQSSFTAKYNSFLLFSKNLRGYN